MKEKGLFILMLFAVLLFGCNRAYVAPAVEHHIVSKLETMPVKFLKVDFLMNPVLDLAEGGDNRSSWKVQLWQLNEEKKLIQVKNPYFAICFGDRAQNGQKLLTITVPLELKGTFVAISDHAGTRFYNHKGESIMLESVMRKVDPKYLAGFLSEIKEDSFYVKEVTAGSAEFKSLEALYNNFRLNEIQLVPGYLKRKYPDLYKKHKSTIPQSELEIVAKNDSVLQGLKDWLGKDTYFYLDLLLRNANTIVPQIGLVKIVQLPSIWGDKINKPGYMEYIPDAEHTAKMVIRGLTEYGSMSIGRSGNGKTKMTESQIAQAKGSVCDGLEFVEDCQDKVLAYNRGVEERNRQREALNNVIRQGNEAKKAEWEKHKVK